MAWHAFLRTEIEAEFRELSGEGELARLCYLRYLLHLKQNREWRKHNLPRIKRYRREYYQAHQDEIRAAHKQYYHETVKQDPQKLEAHRLRCRELMREKRRDPEYRKAANERNRQRYHDVIKQDPQKLEAKRRSNREYARKKRASAKGGAHV